MVFQKLAEDGASVYWHFIANTMLPFLTCSPESRRLRILADREQSFWWNVNADSGLT